METAIITKKLYKRFGKENAIDNINMEICRGEVYALVGKNGAGKTTLMKLLVSMITPDHGEIRILDGEAGNNISQHKKLGVMIENPAFYPYLSAKQNLEYYKRIKGLPKNENIDAILAMVGLENTGNKKFKNFSLGMKQRLGLGLALLGKPELLILDEPTNGLDPEGIKDIRDILIKQNKEYGTTILISSHILSELSQLATKFGFINKGKLIEEIRSEDLQNKSEDCFILKVDKPKKASDIFKQKLDFHDFEIIDDNSIKILKNKHSTSKLNHILLENNVDVFEILKLNVSLEEYFLNLINVKEEKIC